MNFRVLLLNALFLVCGMSLSAQKIGYVNKQEIFTALPEYKQASSDIEVMNAMFQKKGEEMVKDLQTKYQALQQKQTSGELAPIEIEKQAAVLKEEEAKLQEFDRSSQQKIYEKSQELLKPIEEKFSKAIKDVAAENSFTYIFEAGAGVVLYADPTADVTALVKAKLGITQ